MHKELRKIQKALEDQGFVTYVTKKGHLVAVRNGRKVATFSGTPSDVRSLANSIASARRAGFRWPP